ncbi:MAG: anti-sigma factor [Actinomycetota bacterium]|nr:anti-sigma factor [Actinomycetota bacterium]
MSRQEPPDLRELVGDDVSAEELERLGRVHELLVRAGPPPELPGDLAEPPPEPDGTIALLPKRHWRPLAALAAALALAAFGAGWLAASERDSGADAFAIDFRVPMQGTQAAPQAVASIAVGERDDEGNWPMAMTVRGLPDLPEGRHYELWLTRDGKAVAPCGRFRTDGNTVTYLNAPYRLRKYDGWVVTRAGETRFLLRTTEV